MTPKVADRQCKTCKSVFPATDQNFYPHKKGKFGLSNVCKRCHCISSYTSERKRKEKDPLYFRFRELRIKYKLTPQKYLDILATQNGACGICAETPIESFDLCVDHDHTCCSGRYTCGECTRGLLCQDCNRGLGAFKDSQNSLRAADMYIGRSTNG